MLTYKQLLEKRSARHAEARAIQEAATKASRQMTPEEEKRCDEILDECEELDGQIQAAQTAEKRSSRLAKTTPDGVTEERRAPLQRGPEGRSDTDDDPVENPDPSKYRLLRAVRCLIENRPVDGYEGEISQEIARRTGRAAQGFFMPSSLPMEQRALDTTAAAGVIQTTKMKTLIDMLRNRTVVVRMGATLIGGLVGPVDIPKQTARTNSYWVGEGAAVTGSEPTIGQVQLRQATIGGYTDLTRRTILQTSWDMERFAREDLLKTLSLGLDAAALNGSGSSNQPLGILQDSGIPTVAIGTNGGAPTFAKLVEMETTVAASNADVATMAYVTSAQGKGKLKTTVKASGTDATMLWEDNEVNGYPAFASQQIPVNLAKGSGTNLTAAIFGDWSTVFLGLWSGVDILVDPYSLSTSGGVRIVALQDADIKFRHKESLCKIVDLDRS